MIDSVALYYSTQKYDLFTTYKPRDHGTMKIGNTNFPSNIGIGDVHIKTNIECTLELNDD